MRALTLVGVLAAIAACGGSGGNTAGSTGGKGSGGTTGAGGTTGSACPTALCGGTCCASGDTCVGNACCPMLQACGNSCCDPSSQCVLDETGTPSCGVTCRKSADCSSPTPCCEALDNGEGSFSGSGVCAATPEGTYACLCFASSECAFLGADECAPAVNKTGAITGPYLCVADDGSSHDGCAKAACMASDEFCATDQLNNNFCAIACIAGEDYTCADNDVACCNTNCLNTEGGKCCGLCLDGG